MMSISEVSSLTGVSQRTLHYYDEIGLLHPSQTTEAGYRFYDDAAIERLQHILLFRELGFPLKDIRRILDDPAFDRQKALDNHIELLQAQKQRLENIMTLARGIRLMGTKNMNFKAFDHREIDNYTQRAREQWGQTSAWKEYEQGFAQRAKTGQQAVLAAMQDIFIRFGAHLGEYPASPALRCLAEELQAFITQHFYTCTDEIFLSLANMYDGGGEFTANIDSWGGEGTADLAAAAIRSYVKG